jgi:hypothetical protein
MYSPKNDLLRNDQNISHLLEFYQFTANLIYQVIVLGQKLQSGAKVRLHFHFTREDPCVMS